MSGILGHPEDFFAAMKCLRQRSLPALLIALLLAPAAGLGEEIRNHFDSDSVLGAPAYFDLVVLGEPGPARWLVTVDTNPPSGTNRLLQADPRRPDGSIAAAVRRNVDFQDGTVSTFVKKGAGHAGLVLRYVDDKNFLLLLDDTNSGELVLSSYRGGKSTELGRGTAAFDGDWKKLIVTLAGPAVSVSVDDKQKLFDATDPKPAAGRTGVATAGPGDASFDELVIVR